jgi:hypothetical protein
LVIDPAVFSATCLFRVTHAIGLQGLDNRRGSERLGYYLSIAASRCLQKPLSILGVDVPQGFGVILPDDLEMPSPVRPFSCTPSARPFLGQRLPQTILKEIQLHPAPVANRDKVLKDRRSWLFQGTVIL